MLHSLHVRDYMTKTLVSFTPDQDVIEAATILAKRKIGGAPVVNDIGNLVGVLSDSDCIKATIKHGFHPNWQGLVSEFMSSEVATVDLDDSVLDVAERFLQERYRRYPVMEDNRLIGQISRLDVLRALEVIDHG